MNENDRKKAFTEAQKEVREEAVKQLKEFIKRTLEARERHIKARNEAQKKIKILDRDILDLKEGRLDRIEERQKCDPEAGKVSVAIVKKDHVKALDPAEVHHYHHYDRWYYPYQFTWTIPLAPLSPIGMTAGDQLDGIEVGTFTLNNSVAKDNAAGAYTLNQNGGSTVISYVS